MVKISTRFKSDLAKLEDGTMKRYLYAFIISGIILGMICGVYPGLEKLYNQKENMKYIHAIIEKMNIKDKKVLEHYIENIPMTNNILDDINLIHNGVNFVIQSKNYHYNDGETPFILELHTNSDNADFKYIMAKKPGIKYIIYKLFYFIRFIIIIIMAICVVIILIKINRMEYIISGIIFVILIVMFLFINNVNLYRIKGFNIKINNGDINPEILKEGNSIETKSGEIYLINDKSEYYMKLGNGNFAPIMLISRILYDKGINHIYYQFSFSKSKIKNIIYMNFLVSEVELLFNVYFILMCLIGIKIIVISIIRAVKRKES